MLNPFGRRKQLPVSGERATEEDAVFAYRVILKRDPDPAGLAHYRELIAKGLSIDRLSRSFFNSDEYRDRLEDEARPVPVDLGGYQVCIQKRDTDFGQGIYHSHQYEEHVRQAVRDQLRAGDVAVDIGANVGVVTFLCASIVGPAGRVIAVEPNPDNLQLLYRGIALNRFDNVEVLACAVSDRRAIFSLTGGLSNTHLIGARAPDEGGFFAQSLVLDEILGEMPRLDFIKMDIEGHEPRALNGFTKNVVKHRPAMLIEFNPRCLVDLQSEDPLTFLEQIFRLYPSVRVTSAFNDDEVFTAPEPLMDFWHRRNREIADAGTLPNGMLHFDLVTVRG